MDQLETFRSLLEAAPDGVVVVDGTGRIVLVNAQTERLFGYMRAELVGQNVEMLVPANLRERHRLQRQFYLAHPTLRPMGLNADLKGQRKDGSEFPVEIGLSPLGADGVRLVYASVRDITERKQIELALRQARDQLESRVAERTRELAVVNQALRREIAERVRTEEALAAGEAQLRLLVDSIKDYAIIMLDPSGRVVTWSAGAQAIKGYTTEEILGRHFSCFYPPEEVEAGQPERQLQLARDNGRSEDEGWRIRRDGTRFWADVVITALADRPGTLRGFAKITRDLTERKQTEQALRQAQKMEAVGQLTGGIAHDFNNLLTVILGNLQMLGDQVRDDALSAKLVDAAARSAGRGAELTRKLLAFSRRQMLNPASIDLVELVGGMTEMLRRTLGETIEVATRVDAQVPHAFADQGQVENALLNLALNARDAMPRGGRLTIGIEAARLDADYTARESGVAAGDYVMLAVSDTGTGMLAEVLARAVEPFFTTKESGKGSGLGLSMVYGFAKQSGGHLKIYSEPGYGTTVRLYLPVAQRTEARAAMAAGHDHPRGSETVLVVEDDEDVRQVAVGFLDSLGYAVLEAADPRQAMEMLERNARVDLLFTDVILPGGMTGVDLAREACARHGTLKVLYTSGYARGALPASGHVEEGSALLAKPYSREFLATMVREVLDGVKH
jgi:PAS domain S-box-containing protein